MCGSGGILGAVAGLALAPFTGGSSLLMAAGGFAAGSAYDAYQAQEAARKDAKSAANRQYQLQVRAQRTQNNYQKFNNRQQRLAQIREARLRRAQAIAAGAASGVDIGSSNIQGVLGSIGTQEATNEAKITNANTVGNYLSGLNQQIGYQSYLFNNAVQEQQYQMSVFNTALSLGTTAFSMGTQNQGMTVKKPK